MGLSIHNHSENSVTNSHRRLHKLFVITNYVLLSAASSCIFLTLSLRLIPSVCGFFIILLHVSTIVGAVSGCHVATSASNKWYAAHMVATSPTAIFQGTVGILIFTQTRDFLGYLKSYVKEDDGGVILKLAGGLCLLTFCLEWVALTVAFLLRYYGFLEGRNGSCSAVTPDGDVDVHKSWVWRTFQP